MALEEGRRLGSYIIEGPLGRGGMAEVYRANHRTLERAVAIKVINPQFNTDPTFSLRFLREAKAVARLNHPNIITIYDFDEQGELAYLVMELAPGGTFRDQARGFRTLSEAVEGLAPIGAALQYAHERGIVHRDVKPINILINDHGQPVLADFGLARVAAESLDLWTFAGTSAGSPHYMPPEQALGKEIDHRADIYALGIVAYQIITGRLPFHGETPLAIMQQHVTEPPPSVQAVLPDAPAALDAAIQRATAKRPEDRFEDAMAFIAALQQAAAEAPALCIGAERVRADAARQSPGATNGQTRRKTAGPPGAAIPNNEDATLVVSTALPSGSAASHPENATAILRAMLPPGVAVSRADAATAIVSPAPPALPVASSPAGIGPHAIGTIPKRGRPTALNPLQWAVLVGVLAAMIIILASALWLTLAGRGAAHGAVVAGLAAAVYDHAVAIRRVLAVIALLLAILNVTLMRLAVVGDHHYAVGTYRRLRQNHRFVGYTAATIAIAVQMLAWIRVADLEALAARAVLAIAIGAVLLVLAVLKVAIVRYSPSLRRHLPTLGWVLLVFFTLVLVTNLVPVVSVP